MLHKLGLDNNASSPVQPQAPASASKADQQSLLQSLGKVFESKKSTQDKLKDFISDVCVPQVLKQQEEGLKSTNPDVQFLQISRKNHRDVLPYVCYFDGLSFLQRLPTKPESEKTDILAGFKTKSDFVLLQSELAEKEC